MWVNSYLLSSSRAPRRTEFRRSASNSKYARVERARTADILRRVFCAQLHRRCSIGSKLGPPRRPVQPSVVRIGRSTACNTWLEGLQVGGADRMTLCSVQRRAPAGHYHVPWRTPRSKWVPCANCARRVVYGMLRGSPPNCWRAAEAGEARARYDGGCSALRVQRSAAPW